MRRVPVWGMFVLLTAGGVLAQEPAAQPSASYETYKTIYEKNIFSRMRYTPAGQPGNGRTRMEKVVLSLYILRGVAIETKNRVAFVEDEISGQFKRLTIGEQLLNGTIDEIHLDHVLFRQNDQSRTIKIGDEFDRVESEVEKSVDADQSADPNAAAPAPPAAKPSPSAPQDEDAILKKLMERRRQEMGN